MNVWTIVLNKQANEQVTTTKKYFSTIPCVIQHQNCTLLGRVLEAELGCGVGSAHHSLDLCVGRGSVHDHNSGKGSSHGSESSILLLVVGLWVCVYKGNW